MIQGARALLATHRPALLIEVSGDPDESGSPAAALFDELGRLGYRAFTLSGTELQPRAVGERAVDYWFCIDQQ